jgi:hypothetical protein
MATGHRVLGYTRLAYVLMPVRRRTTMDDVQWEYCRFSDGYHIVFYGNWDRGFKAYYVNDMEICYYHLGLAGWEAVTPNFFKRPVEPGRANDDVAVEQNWHG